MADQGTPNTQTLPPGTYSVSETTPDGWTLTSTVCTSSVAEKTQSADNIVLEAGEAVTCTFTNTLKGSLTIQKSAVPKADFPFEFTVSSVETNAPFTPINFMLDDDGKEGTETGNIHDSAKVFTALPAGSYIIQEANLPAGWNLTGIQCCNPIIDNNGNETGCTPIVIEPEAFSAEIDILPGTSQRCTFTNTIETQGKIIVDKITWPATGNENGAPSFNFATTGIGYEAFSLTDGAPANQQVLLPGVYSVSENPADGWYLIDAVCRSSVEGKTQNPERIVLENGESVSCVFHNTVPGSVAIKKTTVPQGSPQKFQFVTSITALNAKMLMDGELNVAQIDPDQMGLSPVTNSWLLTEVLPTSWKLQGLLCTEIIPDKPTTFKIDLVRNQVEIYPNDEPFAGIALCVFTNEEIGDPDPEINDPPISIDDGKIMPETGFPIGRITDLPAQPLAKLYQSTELVLSIPSLNLSIPIIGIPETEKGWDVTWLTDQAGWLAGSAWPTWKGNTVLTAHVWDAYNQPGPFAGIKNLRYGDLIQIESLRRTYTYEVRENERIHTENVEKMMQSEKEDWVTLVTCESYDSQSQKYLSRRMVRAILTQFE